MSNDNVTEVYDYVLALRGVYGRNRTEKFKTVRLRRIPADAAPLTEDEVLALASAALGELKAKRGIWNVDRNRVELTRYSDGVVMESFLLFSGERVIAGVV